MSRHRDWDIACKVYIGNMGNNANKYELEDAFSKYGPLKNVWVARNPPGFAFVEFEDPRDAEDSVRGMDGTRLCGQQRVRVEMSSGQSRGGREGGGGGRDRERGGSGRDRGGRRDSGRRRSRSRSRDRGSRRRRSPSYRSASRSRSRSGSAPRRSRRSRSGSRSE